MSEALMISAEQKKRARNVGYGYLGLAVITLVVFSRRPGDAGFRLTEGGFSLTLPAQQFAYIFGIVFVGLGAAQLWRGLGKVSNIVLALATAMFVMSFLSWATSGESFSLVGMLQDTVSRSVPITLGALGGILCERSGVINIAIEGMLLAGAFTGAVGASLTNLWFGTII
ncbi:MAG: ABC transporter permease, partial [Acidimicrobiaceae bacterium]